MAITALEVYGSRLGGLCWFRQTGIGWPGTHHCLFCYLLAEYDLDWDHAS